MPANLPRRLTHPARKGCQMAQYGSLGWPFERPEPLGHHMGSGSLVSPIGSSSPKYVIWRDGELFHDRRPMPGKVASQYLVVWVDNGTYVWDVPPGIRHYSKEPPLIQSREDAQRLQDDTDRLIRENATRTVQEIAALRQERDALKQKQAEIAQLQKQLGEARAEIARLHREQELNLVFRANIAQPTDPPGDRDDYPFSAN